VQGGTVAAIVGIWPFMTNAFAPATAAA